MNNRQREILSLVQRVFRDHSYSILALADGGFLVNGTGPFNAGQGRRFGSLVSAVDWAKPIMLDPRLDPLYV